METKTNTTSKHNQKRIQSEGSKQRKKQHQLNFFVKKLRVLQETRFVSDPIPGSEGIKTTAVVTLTDSKITFLNIDRILRTYSGLHSIDAVVLRIPFSAPGVCSSKCRHEQQQHEGNEENEKIVDESSGYCAKYEEYMLLKELVGKPTYYDKPCAICTVSPSKIREYHSVNDIFPSCKFITAATFNSSTTKINLTDKDINDNLKELESSSDVIRYGLLKVNFKVRPFWSCTLSSNPLSRLQKVKNLFGLFCMILRMYLFYFDWMRASLIPSISIFGIGLGGWRSKVFLHSRNLVVFQKNVDKQIMRSNYVWHLASNHFCLLGQGSYYEKKQKSALCELKGQVFSTKTSFFTYVPYATLFLLFFYTQLQTIFEAFSLVSGEGFWLWKMLVITTSVSIYSSISAWLLFLFRRYFNFEIQLNKSSTTAILTTTDTEPKHLKPSKTIANSVYIVAVLSFPSMTSLSLLTLLILKLYQMTYYMYKLSTSF